jgi:Cu/Ag efflux protein CusF
MGCSDRSLKSRSLLWAMSGCLLALLTVVFAQASPVEAQGAGGVESELQEYLVVGTVVWAHPASSSISIRGARLLEYLHMQVRAYRVKQPSALLDLRPGDKVMAVFSRKDGMLHRLRRVQAAAKDKHDSQ